MRALVTAGNTRESIDAVRDWGNRFTGNTGYAIARALVDAGFETTLMTSNAAHREEAARSNIRAVAFATHADLKRELEAKMASESFDAVFMTAAIADYRPAGAYRVINREVDPVSGEERWTVANATAQKVKSTFDEVAFLGKRTEKLVDLFRTQWKYKNLLVKFKLEVGIDRERLIEIGQASRKSSGADYLVANTLDMVSGDGAGAYLLGDRIQEFVARASLADRLARLTIDRE